MSGLRDHCESRQVFSHSVSDRGLSGNQDRAADFPGFADSLEDRKVLLNSRKISVLKGAVCEVLVGSAGLPRVADAPHSRRSASNESSPASSQKKLELPGRLGLGQRSYSNGSGVLPHHLSLFFLGYCGISFLRRTCLADVVGG